MTAEQDQGQGTIFSHGAQIWVPGETTSKSSTKSLQNLKNGEQKPKWVKGKVLKVEQTESGKFSISVQLEDGSTKDFKSELCFLQNETDANVDDLVKSDFLHEPGVLQTLKHRYEQKLIYTFSSNILIAINPHQPMPELYTPDEKVAYHGSILGETPPHAYAIAEQAFSVMLNEGQRQAILISGESGAGKTESAKQVMSYLAKRAQPKNVYQDKVRRQNSQKEVAPIEEQVLESNPLLEAFGNAKTLRNNNSSRFGKFVEMSFDSLGRVCGASVSVFLLERSRVVQVSKGERSYHIFYQLCTTENKELKDKYYLGEPSEYRYLSQSGTYDLGGRKDEDEFVLTLEAMRTVGISQEDQDSIFRIAASVLHLGNIIFTGDDEAQLDGPSSEQAVQYCAKLLKVDIEQLKSALLRRNLKTPSGIIVTPLSASAAQESRDTLAKTMYSRLFDWLVSAINLKISNFKGQGGENDRSIGILDIYGFESFQTNSFEQLCINLANEKLQQQFNHHVLEGEQRQYIAEGIEWSYVEFIDNQDCLDLLEGSSKKPSKGVFPLIDEACRLPNTTHERLADSVRSTLQGMDRFEAPKRDQYAFTIDHYAGKVTYRTDYMIDKNRDYVVSEHQALMLSSQDLFLNQLFKDDQSNADQQNSSFKLSSVGFNFRKQLGELAQTLNQCQPHYIRCIKPNKFSKPGLLVPEFILGQLHALGILVAVRIACAGYPTRKDIIQFAQKYFLMIKEQYGGDKTIQPRNLDLETCKQICGLILQQSKLEGWQLGKTKVFLRSGQLAVLEGERGRVLNKQAKIIQAFWRGKMVRDWYKHTLKAIVTIQACYRGHVGRLEAQVLRRERAASIIQNCWKGYKVRKFVRVIRSAVVFQKFWRRYVALKEFKKHKCALLIQRWYRRVQRRRNIRLFIAALIIQKWYRGYRIRKETRYILAARKIQKAIRAYLLRNLYYTTKLLTKQNLSVRIARLARKFYSIPNQAPEQIDHRIKLQGVISDGKVSQLNSFFNALGIKGGKAVTTPKLEERLNKIRRGQSMAPSNGTVYLSFGRAFQSTNGRYFGAKNGKKNGTINGRNGKRLDSPDENQNVDLNVIRASDKLDDTYEIDFESLISSWEKMVNNRTRKKKVRRFDLK